MQRLIASTRGRGAIALIAAMAALVFASAASAAPTPPFKQCPPVGADTSCGTLIVINANGSLTAYHDPTQGPYDSVEDSMIGVQNNSSSTVTSIALKGEFIFGLDGDGICAGFTPGPSGCPFGTTGYEGPNTSFTIANYNEGTVNFTNGELAAGKSTYFSLEGDVNLECTGTKCEQAPPSPVVDTESTGQGAGFSKIKVSTTGENDLLVAFVAGDGTSKGGQNATVSGGGLSWSLAGRENKYLGTAEVWTAKAPAILTNAGITAQLNSPNKGQVKLTVVAFKNAPGIGAVGTSGSKSGAPSGTVTTTAACSWVWASGNDWAKSTARTPGPGQTIVQQSFDAVGDTYWVQNTTVPTPVSGTSVTINDTAPTTDPFNLVLVEVL